MDYLSPVLETQILGNSLQNIVLAFSVFLGTYFLIYLFKKILEVRLQAFVEKTSTKIDDILLRVVSKLINIGGLLLAFSLAVDFLDFSVFFNNLIDKGVVVLGAFIITWVVQDLFTAVIDEYFRKLSKNATKSFVPFIKNLLKIFIWLIAGIFILSNLGYKITSLAAGLGIGGLAIALAVKPTLEAFFASVAIFTDRPFEIGDYIQFGGDSGTVQHIGLRTTIIKTTSGTELIVPNTELINTKVENIAKRSGQRIDASVGVVYETKTKKLEKAIESIKDILDKHECIEEDIRVWFDNFGDSALIIRFTYFVDASLPYVERMAIVSDVNFLIKKDFEKEKIEMAYPTQTVYVKK